MKHTERIKALLAQGHRQAAQDTHNAQVARQFEIAKGGGIINLTDLMAAHEELHIDALKKHPRQ